MASPGRSRASSVAPEPARARIRTPGRPPSLSPHFPSLPCLAPLHFHAWHRTLAPPSAIDSRSSTPPLTNRLGEKFRREVFYHLAKPCFPGCGHLDGIVNLLHHHHRDTDRNSSPIPAVSGHPRRHRVHERLRGEHALLPTSFPSSP